MQTFMNGPGVLRLMLVGLVWIAPLAAEQPTAENREQRAGVLECAKAASRRQTINVGAGIYTEQARVSTPIEISVPSGTDTADFANCLDARGLNADVNKDRYLLAVEACRNERKTRVGYRIAATPGMIGGDDGLTECVKKRMGGIEVEVEAIGP